MIRALVRLYDGTIEARQLTRANSIAIFCSACRQPPKSPPCTNKNCRLFPFKDGQSLAGITVDGRPATAEAREKAVRWTCLCCVQTGDGELGRYEDVKACPEKHCPLFAWRLIGKVDRSIELK